MNRPLLAIEITQKGVAGSSPSDIVGAELPCGFHPNSCDLWRTRTHIDRESHHGGQGRNEKDGEEQRIF